MKLSFPPIPPPFFSIIILCWNSNNYIHKCLESLKNQTFQDFEVLLVDNNSPDPVPGSLINDYSTLNIRHYRLNTNLGFAGGNNFGASKAKGGYLVLLNSDAFPTSNWLENIKKAIDLYPQSFFASKLLMANYPSRLDGTGDTYHFSGMVWRTNHNRLEKNVRQQEGEVFSACGAAAIYPKAAFDEVGGFDEDYFAYVEDVDLGFRLQLVGYKCIYLPDAVVHHVGSGSTQRRSDLSVYYGQRNLIWTFMKNIPSPLIYFLLPFHILANIFLLIISIFRHQGKITLQAKVDAMKKIPKFIMKRKKIHDQRKISVCKLISLLNWNSLSPIKKFFSE